MRLRYEKIRPGSSLSSAPPTSTASAFIPISCMPVEVVEDARASSARARACRRAPATATPPVVWSSSSSSANPIARSRSPSSRRDIVVEFVTKRMRWPVVAQPAHRVDGARDRLAGNVQHTVDVEQNRRHGRRVYSVGSRASASPGRAGRAGSTRRRARRASRRSSTSRPRQALSDAERRRVLERLGPVVRAIAQDERSQLRNRELATERIVEQVAEAARPRRKRRPTAADRGVARAAPRARSGARRSCKQSPPAAAGCGRLEVRAVAAARRAANRRRRSRRGRRARRAAMRKTIANMSSLSAAGTIRSSRVLTGIHQ